MCSEIREIPTSKEELSKTEHLISGSIPQAENHETEGQKF